MHHTSIHAHPVLRAHGANAGRPASPRSLPSPELSFALAMCLLHCHPPYKTTPDPLPPSSSPRPSTFPVSCRSQATAVSAGFKSPPTSAPSCSSHCISRRFLPQFPLRLQSSCHAHIYHAISRPRTCVHVANSSTLLALFSANSNLLIKTQVKKYTSSTSTEI